MKGERLVILLLTGVCILALLMAACSAKEVEQDSSIVAAVGDDFTVQFSRLQAFHSNHEFGARYPDSELNGYEEALSLLVFNRLKNIDFFETGMHRDSALALELQRIVNDELINDYFEEAHLAKYVNEESIREYHEGMSKEIHYSQILLEKSQPSTSETQREIENTIDDILTAAEDGESFETLRSIYSREPTANGAENTRSVQWNADSRNQIFNQLYDLHEGDLKVLETASSYVIINVDRVTQREVPPLEQVRDEIVSNLRTMYYSKSQDEFEEEKERLVDRSSIQWNQEGLEQLIEWSSQPNFFDEFYRDTLKSRIDAGDNFEILNYSEGRVDAEEYLRLLDNVYIMDNSRSNEIEEHKIFITEALERDRIIEKAKEMELDEQIINPNRPNQLLQNRVIQLYNAEKIDSKVPEPGEDDLREFYQAHKESLFYQLPRVRVFMYVYDDSVKAADAIQRYKEGTPFEDLEAGYLVRTFEKNRDGEIKSYMRNEKPYLGEAAFRMSESEVTGPISFDHDENGRQFAVLKHAWSEPEKQLSYSEVEDRIESVFKDYHRRKIVESVKDELWEKYPVEIYKENLKRQISSL